MEIVLIIAVVVVIAFELIRFLNAKNTVQRSKELKLENSVSENAVDLQDNNGTETIYDCYPFHKKLLLTKNEFYFYKRLKEITDSASLQILAKIRLADLIEVNSGLTKQEWNRYFSKIKAKHIDFAIVQDMRIIMLIELDDNTHNNASREKRDIFVENALTNAGYLFVRTYGDVKCVEKELYKLQLLRSMTNS